MTIAETNMLRRWEVIANADLGYEVEPIAKDLSNLFNHIVENGYMNNVPENALRLVRGFKINTQIDVEECSLVDCFDINTVQMSKYGIDEFDYFLMNDLGWVRKYHIALGYE